MFATLKQIFKPQNKDLRKRILFTLVCLFIFKLGTTIIVPGIDKESLGTDNLGFLELINVMGGGAMERFSIFSLGVMPYISASIIVQLLQMDIIPYFSELSKQGQVGRNKLNVITLNEGYGWFDTGTFKSLFSATNFVATIQEHQNITICCPEEIAYKNGWLDKETVLKQAELMKKNTYGKHLLEIVKEK